MRIVLVQPHDDGAALLAERLARVGHVVSRFDGNVDRVTEFVAAGRPGAVVIGLDGLPDEALVQLDALHAVKALATTTLLFTGGTAEALSKAQAAEPRASFTRGEELLTSLASLRS